MTTRNPGDEEEKQRRFAKVFTRASRDSHDVKVVPCEIEMSSELYEVITLTFLEYSGNTSIENFINNRFLERMKQILSDPTEFGKLMLENVKAVHMLE